MKTKNRFFISAVMVLMVLFTLSCSNDNDANPEYNITQAELDAVSGFIGEYTGGTMAHGGPDGTSADSTIRLVYASISSLDGDIPVGTIVAKNTYKRGADGNKTDELFVSFAMVKREAGYNTEGGDFEYIMIPYNETVDYSAHPYGILPDKNTDGWGKLEMCMGCHLAAGGSDFLFVND
jgi:hypothetical protein